MTSPPSEQGLSVLADRWETEACMSSTGMVEAVTLKHCADELRRALASRSSPDGWVLVPREPTPAMLQAACDKHAPGEPMKPGNHAPDSYYSECPRFKTRRKVWASMVSLAPAPADTALSGAQGTELSLQAPADPIPSPTSEPSAAGDPTP